MIAGLLAAGAPGSSPANEPRITIPKVSSAPEIDGVLDDAVWQEAEVTSDFFQRVPVEGAPASEKTVVYLAYDSDMIYIGARLFDRTPERIAAKELREDANTFRRGFLYGRHRFAAGPAQRVYVCSQCARHQVRRSSRR